MNHKSVLPKASLEQWATLKAVIEEGSFANAAERLNKSQSSVSYIIARLNDMMPVPIVHQQGRRTVLTKMGKGLYKNAMTLLELASGLERKATYMAEGWEAEVVVVAEMLTPMHLMLQAFEQFSSQCLLTNIRLLETSLSGTEEPLLERKCQLGITARVPPGFMGDKLCDVQMVPVARPEHPLCTGQIAASQEQLQAYRQIVIRDTGSRREQDAGWLGSNSRWTVSHFSTSIEAVKAGLGFAFVPKEQIERELKDGSLKQIKTLVPARIISLYLIITDGDHAGPSTVHLAKQLKEVFAYYQRITLPSS